jgi:hypothetical protein
VQSGNNHQKNRSDRKIEMQTEESEQVASHPSKKGDSIPEYAPEVLTGGHGGAIPALIVRVIRNLFTGDSHSSKK